MLNPNCSEYVMHIKVTRAEQKLVRRYFKEYNRMRERWGLEPVDKKDLKELMTHFTKSVEGTVSFIETDYEQIYSAIRNRILRHRRVLRPKRIVIINRLRKLGES